MSDFFANLRSGVEFPQVVMNQGPMPGTGGLPRPLHDTVDGRINYNSSLLGDLEPYAYGEPGFLSSQTSYLNIPHKLQKIVPAVFLPEARHVAVDFFDLSHPVDDGDLAFTLRMDRNSFFCTGARVGGARRSPLGTAIDPLVNLATVNYILSGFQLGLWHGNSLWREFFYNMDSKRFDYRDASTLPTPSMDDIIYLVRHCIRPFGIVRGSEKQGGQNEATASPATWPVNFIVSVTLDGKESNVMNLWHHLDFSAGEDLVLSLKLMPVRPYTLNHYYKGVKRQTWESLKSGGVELFAWQLVPNVMHLQPPSDDEKALARKAIDAFHVIDANMQRHVDEDGGSGSFLVRRVTPYATLLTRTLHGKKVQYTPDTPWQDLGYWHIGRSQIMSRKYGTEEYWHNDSANDLRTNHLDLTLQPTFVMIPSKRISYEARAAARTSARLQEERASKRLATSSSSTAFARPEWKPMLTLERLPPHRVEEERWDRGLGLPAPAPRRPPVVMEAPRRPVVEEVPRRVEEEEDIGTLSFSFDAAPPLPLPVASSKPPKGRAKKGSAQLLAGGSLLRADGTSEPSVLVGML